MKEEKAYKPNPKWSRKSQSRNQGNGSISAYYDTENRPFVSLSFLNFCLKDGRELALPLGDLEAMRFEPARGIFLFFGMTIVMVEGLHLRELYAALIRREVKQIREFSDREDDRSEKPSAIVTSITLETVYLEK